MIQADHVLDYHGETYSAATYLSICSLQCRYCNEPDVIYAPATAGIGLHHIS